VIFDLSPFFCGMSPRLRTLRAVWDLSLFGNALLAFLDLSPVCAPSLDLSPVRAVPFGNTRLGTLCWAFWTCPLFCGRSSLRSAHVFFVASKGEASVVQAE